MLPTEKEYMELRQIAWNLRNELDNVINECDVLRQKLEIAKRAMAEAAVSIDRELYDNAYRKLSNGLKEIEKVS